MWVTKTLKVLTNKGFTIIQPALYIVAATILNRAAALVILFFPCIILI